jgi:hypothetical protein
MKQRTKGRQKLSKALLFSLILHIVCMGTLNTVQRDAQLAKDELFVQVEIMSQSRKPVPRRLQRPLHVLPVSEVAVPQSQSITASKPALTAPRPKIATTTLHDISSQQAFSMLTEESIPLSAVSASVGDTSFAQSNRAITRGKQISSGGGLVRAKKDVPTRESLGLENETMLSEVSHLTQPDVALVKIGHHLLKTRKSNTIDIVFVIDASKSMRNDIDAVRNHLNQMTDLLETGGLDFTVGLVAFRDGTSFSLLGWDFQITPQTTSVQEIKKKLAAIQCRGGEKALDALVQAASKVKFRKGAERRFILVTDEYVSGSYSPKKVLRKLRSKKIGINVIGRDEPFQKLLVQGSGGLWIPISSLRE